MITFHNRLVHDLLQLLVLPTLISARPQAKLGVTFRLFPTIIFRTRKSSPFEMKPSLSTSYTLNATAANHTNHETGRHQSKEAT